MDAGIKANAIKRADTIEKDIITIAAKAKARLLEFLEEDNMKGYVEELGFWYGIMEMLLDDDDIVDETPVDTPTL